MRISDWSSDVCSSDLFVHFDILVAEDFGADNGVLHEIFRNATADHEETGGARLDLDVRQFAEVSDRIHRQILTARLHGIDLMLNEAETRRGIGEGRADEERKSVVSGKRVSVREILGG